MKINTYFLYFLFLRVYQPNLCVQCVMCCCSMTREWLIYHSNEYTYQSRLIKRGKLSLYHSNDHWEKGNKLMSVMSKWTREEIFSCFALEHQERSTPREIKDLEIVLLLFPYHTLSIASQQRVNNTYITTVTLVSSVEGKKWLVVWITIRISLMRDFGTYFSPGIPCNCVRGLVFQCL